ncbi:unnamed protein product [Closterium sp. NIES-64]|nr:unnamed protein product [Closterium sp. NIES-64]
MSSPVIRNLEAGNRWDVEKERVLFNRRILRDGSYPFGRRKGNEGLHEITVGDQLLKWADGTRSWKSPERLTRDLGSKQAAEVAADIVEALSEDWKERVLKLLTAEEIAIATKVVRTTGRGVQLWWIHKTSGSLLHCMRMRQREDGKTWLVLEGARVKALSVSEVTPMAAVGDEVVGELGEPRVEVFASQLPDVSFARLLDRFVETSKLDGTYFLCRTDNIRRVATMLDKIKGLTLRDRFAFCSAPANARDPTVMAALLRFAHQYAEGKPVPLLSGGRGEEEKLGDEERSGGWEGGKGRPGGDSAGQWVRGTWQRTAASDLMALETKHQVASLYLWLSYQFPKGAFPDASLATDKAQNAAKQLSTALLEARTPNLSSSFGKPGSVRDRYGPGLTDVQQQQLWYIEQQKRRREEERRRERAEGVGEGGRKGEGEEEEEGGVDDEMRQLIASARLKRSAGRRKLSAGASQR